MKLSRKRQRPLPNLVLLAAALALLISSLNGQGLNPSMLLHPTPDSWPTYNGDYSGKRFSSLKQINKSNVGKLGLVWAFQTDVTNGPGLKSTPLLVNGILYFTDPNDVWAVDARTGRQNWHYHYPSNAGLHIGQRGLGMYRNRLFYETPDDHLLCLDARTGHVLWNRVLADVKLGYWATMAPLVVKNHVLTGISGDFNDLHGFIDSFDPETGKRQWKWSSLPKPGEPGADTWPNASAMKHGGGMTWLTGTYDPELNLVYWGTANPNPVMDGSSRKGANLFTCTIAALNPDTGKLVWYFQASPHDVHDWDAVQTPVLVDAKFGGKPRKLLLQASRNGYYFVLDRTNGKVLLSTPYAHIDWSSGINSKGQPISKRDMYPSPAGTLVEPDAIGATNWMAPSFDPQTGLLYVDTHRSYSLYYAYHNGKPEGFAGRDVTVWSKSFLRAIDYQTGKSRWKVDLGSGWNWAGVLSTAGGVVFTGDVNGNVLALDAATGKILWHTYAGGQAEQPPITYELDDRQYLVVGAHGVVYCFALPVKP
ncbi:MAG TPA: acido-empty-quinoprotein group A [Bryobacteraceae bacterium]